MHIHRLDLKNQADIRRFVELPFEIYRGCPLWVPPLLTTMYDMLNPKKHPFYLHSEAAFFLVVHGGDTLGRIAVMNNRRFNTYREKSSAFFGFFESVQDQEVAGKLFAAAHDWAHMRKLDEVLGPRGLLGSDTGGILVKGFEFRPAMGVPYNFAYYDELIKAAGYQKDTDFFSGFLNGNHTLPERFYSIVERIKEQRKFKIKKFHSKAELRQWIPRLVAVHAEAFKETHTYFPPSQTEMQNIIALLLTIADPRLVRLVMKGNQIAGFIFAYPDLSSAIQKANGRLLPLGWLHLLIEKQRVSTVDVNGVGLLPQYRGLGGNTLLYVELTEAVRALGVKHIEVIQVNETNLKSYADMQAIGVSWHKKHRIYQQKL